MNFSAVILQGTADLYCSQTCYQVRPGDILIANANELHSGFCKSAYDSYVLIFDIRRLSAELAVQNPFYQPLIRDDPQLQALIQRIITEEQLQQPGYKALCKALVTELAVSLSRRYLDSQRSGHNFQKRKQELDRLAPVTDYLAAHYAENVAVSQLAEMLFLSEGRFCHLFREIMGCAPVQYVHDLRLQKAWSLLNTGRYNVTQVAQMVGFQDYNNFGRHFKKRYGVTPHAVRSGKALQE